jgi:hypothetical protein
MALVPPPAGAAAPSELKSVTVTLPGGDRLFPPGPGSAQINSNCLACHSAGMVLNQPTLSKEAWAAEVNKMIGVFKAPVAAQDVGAIIDYLVRMQAK